MSSLRRILSSRANGARSTGPVTPAGKSKSSKNAMRHGLLAQCIRLDVESEEAFNSVCDLFIERFGPSDEVELGMVQEMIAAAWRLRRAWAIENGTMNEAFAAQPPGDQISRLASAFASAAREPHLALLHRYETRLHSMYQRAFHNLLLLRTATVPNEPNPISGHPGALPQPARLASPSAAPAAPPDAPLP